MTTITQTNAPYRLLCYIRKAPPNGQPYVIALPPWYRLHKKDEDSSMQGHSSTIAGHRLLAALQGLASETHESRLTPGNDRWPDAFPRWSVGRLENFGVCSSHPVIGPCRSRRSRNSDRVNAHSAITIWPTHESDRVAIGTLAGMHSRGLRSTVSNTSTTNGTNA